MFVLGLGGAAAAASVSFSTRAEGLRPLAVVWTYAGLAWLALQPNRYPRLSMGHVSLPGTQAVANLRARAEARRP